jgi:hypothetical protein
VHVIAQCLVLRRKMDIATAHGEQSSLPRRARRVRAKRVQQKGPSRGLAQ